MEKILLPVGKMCPNRYSDVCIVQTLLNHNLYRLTKVGPLDVDGNCGGKTIDVIIAFQKEILKMNSPDGKIAPTGQTFLALNKSPQGEKNTAGAATTAKSEYCFPLAFRPLQSYKDGMRCYGAKRSNGRLHAGCDLYAPVGTPIYALDKGVVRKDLYAFYLGTNALEITHPDFVARYGELKSVAPGIKKDSEISKGQLIGYIGHLQGLDMSMLHLELYSGKVDGELTVKANTPYQRRADVFDPSFILDKAVCK